MSYPTSKGYWLRGHDVPTVFSAGAFRAGTAAERGGVELEVPAATLNGVWILGWTCDATAGAFTHWIRSRNTQFLTTTPTAVPAANQNAFGLGTPVAKAVARTGTSAAATVGTYFGINSNSQLPISPLPSPLWIPGGSWFAVYADVVNSAITYSLFWIEVPVVGG